MGIERPALVASVAGEHIDCLLAEAALPCLSRYSRFDPGCRDADERYTAVIDVQRKPLERRKLQLAFFPGMDIEGPRSFWRIMHVHDFSSSARSLRRFYERSRLRRVENAFLPTLMGIAWENEGLPPHIRSQELARYTLIDRKVNSYTPEFRYAAGLFMTCAAKHLPEAIRILGSLQQAYTKRS